MAVKDDILSGRRAITVLVAVAVALLGLTASAVAAAEKGRPPQNDSAIGQYIEDVPSGGGPTALGISPTGKKPGRLSAGARARLRQGGGADTSNLEQLSTSPGLGAPSSAHKTRSHRGSADHAAGSGVPSAVRSAIDDESGGAGMLWLALALLGIAALLLGALRARARRSA